MALSRAPWCCALPDCVTLNICSLVHYFNLKQFRQYILVER
jgi:hypothetical protein